MQSFKQSGQVQRASTVSHAACRAASRQPRLLVVSSSSSDSTVTTTQQKLDSWRQRIKSKQDEAAKYAAASGTAVALALAAPSTYDLLSTADLPPVSMLLEVLGGLLAASAALAKLVHGDNVHLELHK